MLDAMAQEDDARVVVIGSGPTGAVAAATLVAAHVPVTVLESGERRPHGVFVRAMGRTLLRGTFGERQSPTYRVTDGFPATWIHVLQPGGLSNYWTGAVPRFAPNDFSDGGQLHERYLWPVTYDDIRPYYERLERMLRVAGTRRDAVGVPAPLASSEVHVPDAWKPAAAKACALGQALVPVPLVEASPWAASAQATAFNSFTRLIAPLRRAAGFRLILGAHVLRLEWDGAKRRVTSVTYFDRVAHVERRLAAAAVIVAAGPLESTRLLLNSTSADFQDGLGNTDGILGRYLHDHLVDVCIAELERPVPRLRHPLNLTRPPYGPAEPLMGSLATVGNTRLSVADRVLNLTTLPTHTMGVIVFGSVVPREENRVARHCEARDEFGQPLLELSVRFDDPALANLTRARERAREVLEAVGGQCRIRSLSGDPVPGTSAHYGGTARMHASRKHGVLDRWNRLHAVPNVLVTDASAFTTGPEKNPTLTAMALSVRAAEQLARDLRTRAPLPS